MTSVAQQQPGAWLDHVLLDSVPCRDDDKERVRNRLALHRSIMKRVDDVGHHLSASETQRLEKMVQELVVAHYECRPAESFPSHAAVLRRILQSLGYSEDVVQHVGVELGNAEKQRRVGQWWRDMCAYLQWDL